ncbi:hypothetical protein SUDANB19_01878 [Streptomyces sp. enrichment culture]
MGTCSLVEAFADTEAAEGESGKSTGKAVYGSFRPAGRSAPVHRPLPAALPTGAAAT